MTDQDTTSPTKPKVARDRLDITFPHYAVRLSDGDVIQFPQATGYDLDDGDLIFTGDVEGGRLALFRSGVWEGIYYPAATRLIEQFYATEYDADGNEIPDQSGAE
jgi:hypothetical protein